MQTEPGTQILPSEVIQVVESVFATMLSLTVNQEGTPWFPSADRLTSALHLAGDWNGAVLLECSRSQACRLAGRFLSQDPPESVDDDVRDVLGELANMIGGNMKSGMVAGISLSMPTVMDGSNYDLHVCGATVQDQLSFQCEDGEFLVTVMSTAG